MAAIIFQLQVLLAGLSLLAPLLPEEGRARAAQILAGANAVLAAAGAVGANAEEFALKLGVLRAEVEALAASGRAVSSDEFAAALARVRAGADALRAALQDAEAGG